MFCDLILLYLKNLKNQSLQKLFFCFIATKLHNIDEYKINETLFSKIFEL